MTPSARDKWMTEAYTNFINVYANHLMTPTGVARQEIDPHLSDSEMGQIFANCVATGPRDHARDVCSLSPRYAYLYAKHVDHRSHPVTWAGVVDSEYKEIYLREFGIC